MINDLIVNSKTTPTPPQRGIISRHCGLDPQSPEKGDSDFRQNDEQN
jgi:hypothetical protein